MRGQTIALAVALLPAARPTAAQSAPPEEGQPRTAEQFIETARRVYSVREPRTEPCVAPVGNEIVVCREVTRIPDQRLPSPTERAQARGERPPDPLPQAPYVLGLPECGVQVVCHRMGSAPPPIHLIDFASIPEALPPEQAALVGRVEDAASSEGASPAAAP